MKTKSLILSLFLALPLFGILNADLWDEVDYYFPNVLDAMSSYDSKISSKTEGNEGLLAWSNHQERYLQIFHIWDSKGGLKTVDLTEDLSKYDFKFEDAKPVYPFYIDNNRNVYLRIIHAMQSPAFNGGQPISMCSLGVWHEDNGFRIIHLPEIDRVGFVTFKDEFIVIEGDKIIISGHGGYKNQHQIVIIENPVKNMEVAVEPETTSSEDIDKQHEFIEKKTLKEEQSFWERWWPFKCKLKMDCQ